MITSMKTKTQPAIWQFSAGGNSTIDPTTVPARSGTFAAAAINEGTTTLLVLNDADGLHSYFLATDTAGSANAASQLANTLNAAVTQVEDLPVNLDDFEAVGFLEFDHGSAASRESMVGTNPSETARLLAPSMPMDSWVAITLRKPVKSETRSSNTWFSHRLGSSSLPQHHSASTSAVVIGIWAGSNSKNETRDLLNAASAILPGFDLSTKPRMVSKYGVGPVLLGISALLVAAVVFGIPYVAAMYQWEYFSQVTLGLYATAAIAGLGGFLRMMGTTPSKYKSLRIGLDSNRFPAPAKRTTPAAKPRNATTKGDRQIKASDGDYPLAASSFLVGPQVIVGIVAPHAGLVSGEEVASSLDVALTLRKAVGPVIGMDASGNYAHLNSKDLHVGLAVLGQAGSGKSHFIRSIYGWNAAERVMPSGRPNFPGAKNAMIAFETKGPGANEYAAWHEAALDLAQDSGVGANDPKWRQKNAVLRIDAGDTATPTIAMFAGEGTVKERAARFVEAMIYAFDDGSIQYQSKMTLINYFTAVLGTPMSVIKQVPSINHDRSPIYYVAILLGVNGDQLGVDLASAIISEAVRQEAAAGNSPTTQYTTESPLSMLVGARDALIPNYDNKSTGHRDKMHSAPMSKITDLLNLDFFFEPSRVQVPWSRIISGHKSVIINTAFSGKGSSLSSTQAELLAKMLLFTLNNSISTNCGSFLKEGKWVSIFSDELASLSKRSPELIMWMKDQGREFGVRPFMATQRSTVLHPDLRSTFLTFNSLVSFSQQETDTAEEVAKNMSSMTEAVEPKTIMSLPRYTGMVRTSVDLHRQRPFTFKALDYEADRKETLAIQGYGPNAKDTTSTSDNDDTEESVWV